MFLKCLLFEDLVTFTEEILNGKRNFLCSGLSDWSQWLDTYLARCQTSAGFIQTFFKVFFWLIPILFLFSQENHSETWHFSLIFMKHYHNKAKTWHRHISTYSGFILKNLHQTPWLAIVFSAQIPRSNICSCRREESHKIMMKTPWKSTIYEQNNK